MSEQELTLVERLQTPIEPARYQTKGVAGPVVCVSGDPNALNTANRERAEARARITQLQAVVDAWRERLLAEEQMTIAFVSSAHGDMDVARARFHRANQSLVELNQIEPPEEGCYLKLKDPQ